MIKIVGLFVTASYVNVQIVPKKIAEINGSGKYLKIQISENKFQLGIIYGYDKVLERYISKVLNIISDIFFKH